MRSPEEDGYLKETESVKHLIRGILTEDEVRFEMIDQAGVVFDEYERSIEPTPTRP